MATGCSREDQSTSGQLTVRAADEVTKEIQGLSDQLLDTVPWPEAEVDIRHGRPRIVGCANTTHEDSNFMVRHSWKIWNVPDVEMDGLKARIEGELAELGWVAINLHRVNSKAQQHRLLAETRGSEFGLHIEFTDHRDIGGTRDGKSAIVVSVQSSCYAPGDEGEDGSQAVGADAEVDQFSPEALDARFGNPQREGGE